MDFYEILQEIMTEKGLNIPTVARMCGLSDGTVRSIITRKQKNVALEVAFKLSYGLDVSLERLNGMPEPEESAEPADKAPQELDDAYLLLNAGEREALMSYVSFLVQNHRDKKKHPPQDG